MIEHDDDHVEPQDPARENSPIGEVQMEMSESDRDCFWNDKRYSDGATVCDARVRYKCWSGKWVDVGQC